MYRFIVLLVYACVKSILACKYEACVFRLIGVVYEVYEVIVKGKKKKVVKC